MPHLLFLLLMFASALAQETYTALLLYEDQKELGIEDCPNCLNFLTLDKKVHDTRKSFDDFTVCFRFNLLSFRGDGKMSYPFWMHQDAPFHSSTSLLRNQIFYHFKLRLLGGGGPMVYPHAERTDEVVKQGGMYRLWPIYKEEINANSWHSICFGLDLEKKLMYVVHNGKTQNNFTQPDIWAEASKGFDTSMVEPLVFENPWGNKPGWRDNLYLAKPSGAMLGINYWSFSGYLTDYQIFGHSLSAEEMYAITSCESFKKGDIYSWEVDDWEPFDKELQKNKTTAVQYRKEEIPKSSLCKTSQRFTFFPDKYDMLEGMNLCRRFGGEMVDVPTHRKGEAIVDFVGEIMDNPKYERIRSVHVPFVAYTDTEELNVWRHYETGELPEEPFIWNTAEPNGGMVENCANLVIKKEERSLLFNDMSCTSKLPTVCQGIKEIVVKLRGICKNSKMDTTFSMVEGDLNRKRYFSGNTGWKLFWDDKKKFWKLGSPKEENIFALHTELETYPLGKNFWKIVNDTRCSYPNSDKVLINMSPCSSSNFTCDDGSCIPMTKR